MAEMTWCRHCDGVGYGFTTRFHHRLRRDVTECNRCGRDVEAERDDADSQSP